MEPLFDAGRVLQAWMRSRTDVFDVDMRWIAFVRNGNAFDSADLRWLGPLVGNSLLDTRGKPVLWAPAAAVEDAIHPQKPLHPMRPIRPIIPIRPVRPLPPPPPKVPVGGWSRLAFHDWLTQGKAPPDGMVRSEE